jgi:hypothetical protein
MNVAVGRKLLLGQGGVLGREGRIERVYILPGGHART